MLDDDQRQEGLLPLQNFKIGDTLQVKVLGFGERSEGKHKKLAITHAEPTGVRTVELTVKPSEIATPPDNRPAARLTYKDLKPGMKVFAYVQKVSTEGIWVQISPWLRGRVYILDITNDLAELQNIRGWFLPSFPSPPPPFPKKQKKKFSSKSILQTKKIGHAKHQSR